MQSDVATKLDDLCRGDGLRTVAQPIVRLTDMTVVGYEALTRIDDAEGRSIQWWLDAATEHGLRSRFEVACWRSVTQIGDLPDDGLLFANVSPATLLEPELWLLRGAMPARLVIELTEQAPVDDYQELRDELSPWLASGARIAIDDTGAGYSSLRHVIELGPDFLKLDRAMVTDIDRDRNRLALVRSLVAFAREVGTSVIAEGIERKEELETLRTAGVAYGQGYLLALARTAVARAHRRDATEPIGHWYAFAATTSAPARVVARRRATRTKRARSSSITSSAKAR